MKALIALALGMGAFGGLVLYARKKVDEVEDWYRKIGKDPYEAQENQGSSSVSQ